MSTTPHGLNPFRDAVVDAVHSSWPHQRGEDLRADGTGWTAVAGDVSHIPPVTLMSPVMTADATEHGALVLPTGTHQRFALDVRYRTYSEDLRPDVVRVVPGGVERRHVGKATGSVAVWDRLTATRAGLAWDVLTTEGGEGDLWPTLVWTPADAAAPDELPLLRPAQLGVASETATSSNSRLPDPHVPAGAEDATVHLHVIGASLPAMSGPPAPQVLLAERETPTGTVVTGLPGWPRAHADRRVELTIDGPPTTSRTAEAALVVRVPDPAVQRQLPFSVHHSLMSEAVSHRGRRVSLHGRRDRGMGDVAHMHQSYQMHFVALAAGAVQRVEDELLAFVELVDADGRIRRCPGTRSDHRYVPGFTEEHLLLGVHRYVSWTGDLELLSRRVTSALGDRTVLDHLRAVADGMLDDSHEGLLTPCGWLDAWPPRVRAQAQVSMTGAEALEALAQLVRAVDQPGSEDLRESARALRTRIDDVFLDPATGLYAEHLFDSGTTGGTLDDFWSHTQITAVLSGQARDARGLDHVRRRCFRRGITGLPPSTLDAAYVADSTDADVDLALDSTATWMLATWPELTHQYALAEVSAGRPDLALEAVRAQLPESLHEVDAFVAPWVYAEKYLFPGTEPWLATWGGDPSLVEVVLSGFLGIRPDLDGLRIAPALPAAWRGSPVEASFTWCGRRHRLALDGHPDTQDLEPRR